MTRRTGQLVTWKATFGWLRDADGRETFCHVTSFDHCDPILDRFYTFDVEPDPRDSKRTRAVNISRIENRADESQHRKALEVESAWRSLPFLRAEKG